MYLEFVTHDSESMQVVYEGDSAKPSPPYSETIRVLHNVIDKETALKHKIRSYVYEDKEIFETGKRICKLRMRLLQSRDKLVRFFDLDLLKDAGVTEPLHIAKMFYMPMYLELTAGLYREVWGETE